MGFFRGFFAGGAVSFAATVVCVLATARARTEPASLLGHHRYPLADPRTLAAVDGRGEVLLQPAAAAAFRAMRAVAEGSGVLLVPLSGFRDLEHQDRLFFAKAAALNQTLRERSRTCAPPGFSEHHTGYSLDVGDGSAHPTDLDETFAQSAGFAWLTAHAATFHFELSFPPHNRQGVQYEPWHWRFVGDRPSFRTFYAQDDAVPFGPWRTLARLRLGAKAPRGN